MVTVGKLIGRKKSSAEKLAEKLVGDDGFAGGAEAHRTPEGFLPPPRGGRGGGRGGGGSPSRPVVAGSKSAAARAAELARKQAELKRIADARSAQIAKEQARIQKLRGVVATRQREKIIKPIGVVTGVSKEEGLAGQIKKLRDERSRLATLRLRGKGTTATQAKEAALTAEQIILTTIAGFAALPKSLKAIAKNPVKFIKGVPGEISRGGAEFGILAKESPVQATFVLGGEIVALVGTSSAINKLEKLGRVGLAKASPRFVGTAKTGTKLEVAVGGGKKIRLDVVDRIPTSTIAKQLSLAGKRVTAISSQADNLLTLFKTRRIVRKPLGVTKAGKKIEEALGTRGKRLLKKLDSGIITKSELILLDKFIRAKRGKGILERAFFADPTGKIRPSRLGILKPKKRGFRKAFDDFFVEDITLRRKKPQLLLFPDTRIAKFPKTLSNIKRKLERGQELTKAESARLLQFQIEKGGKFKPLGFISRESEITLAPGEIIKKVKKVGVTIINGEPVPIIKAEIFKATGKTKTLLSKFNQNRITPRELRLLDRLLKKKTKFDFRLSSLSRGKRVVNVRGLSGAISTTVLRRSSFGHSISRISPRPSSRFRPSRRPSPRPSPRFRPSPRPRPRPRPRPLVRPVLPLSGRKKKVPRERLEQGFRVLGKEGKRFIELSKKRLSKRDAFDRGAFAVQNTTSRTFQVLPAGRSKQLGTIQKKERGEFRKNRKDFRRFRIIKGKKKGLPNKVIEKTSAAINRKGEVLQLRLSKLRREQFGFGKPVKKQARTRRPVINRSPTTLKRNSKGQFLPRKR